MAETKLPVTRERELPAATRSPEWWPFEGLRREIDRLFDDFDRGLWPSPLRRSLFDVEPLWRKASAWGVAPVVDIADKGGAYEITAELPGMNEADIDISLSDDVLTIKGEKKEETEEKKKDYFLSERRYGSFQRSFRLPEGVDTDKIEAKFAKGVLTLMLPKTPEAQKNEKKIAIKSG
jgi:HSP20 family protein